MSDNEKSTQTEEPNFRYNAALAQDIEKKWQKIWDEQGTFWAANVNGDLKDGKGRNAEGRTAYFAMDMFPSRPARACTSATRWATWPPTW